MDTDFLVWYKQTGIILIEASFFLLKQNFGTNRTLVNKLCVTVERKKYQKDPVRFLLRLSSLSTGGYIFHSGLLELLIISVCEIRYSSNLHFIYTAKYYNKLATCFLKRRITIITSIATFVKITVLIAYSLIGK